MVTPVSAPPSLENGDRMDREEFHRRYELRPDIHRAELVEGVVFVRSPMRIPEHDEPATLCSSLLALYTASHPGTRSGGGGTIVLDGQNEYQPDAYIWRSVGGWPRLNSQRYLEGAPQLVVEVAASTVSYDLHDKKEAYRRNGVREYVVWRVLDEAMDFFRLDNGEYVRVEPGDDGIIESREFPGLRFNIPAIVAGDRAGAFAEVR
jgi:Uma2 family endonuclease